MVSEEGWAWAEVEAVDLRRGVHQEGDSGEEEVDSGGRQGGVGSEARQEGVSTVVAMAVHREAAGTGPQEEGTGHNRMAMGHRRRKGVGIELSSTITCQPILCPTLLPCRSTLAFVDLTLPCLRSISPIEKHN